MRNNSSVHLELKLYMIWTKGTHQSAKFQTFDCSPEISPNLYFQFVISDKKHRGVMSHETEE